MAVKRATRKIFPLLGFFCVSESRTPLVKTVEHETKPSLKEELARQDGNKRPAYALDVTYIFFSPDQKFICLRLSQHGCARGAPWMGAGANM